MKRFRDVIRFAAAVVLIAAPALSAEVKSPSEFLGFEVGADRKLADYRQISSYFRALDAASPRLQIVNLGKTTLGEEMIMAVISSEENMQNLPAIRETARKLADPRGLSSQQIDELTRTGKAVVLVTCNIHSTEIASSQMAMEWAHALVTGDDPATRERLSNVVLLLVPSLNPDGQIMETEWYRKYLGTPYEGSQMPWLYHPYAGHDNNRDWFMLTQKETRSLSRAIYHEWFPQVFVDEHQMHSDGPRMFIPPFSDPVDPDVHPLIWREANLIGSNMAFRLEQEGKAGLIYGYAFDAYWLGGTRNTGWWKNITGLLLEIASARLATPVFVEPTELRGGSKGLIEYKAQINHPNPWRGGWWRMRDVMDYGRIASDALIEIVSDRRQDFLRNVAARASAAVAAAPPNGAFVIPAGQSDYPTAKILAALLADHNVELYYDAAGSFWIPMAQPYSKFLHEMLEPQRYPEVRQVAGRDILSPYDVATWTLPMMMGVDVGRAMMPAAAKLTRLSAPIVTSETPRSGDFTLPESPYVVIESSGAELFKVLYPVLRSGKRAWLVQTTPSTLRYAFERSVAVTLENEIANAGLRLSGLSALPANAVALRAPRVGLYKPWVASMDEGWTRWLLEQYQVGFRNIDNATMKKGGATLRQQFDAIILPDLDKAVIENGTPRREDGEMKYVRQLPPEFAGGIGAEGIAALRDFVKGGGTLIAFSSSSDLVIENFNIPVRNALAKARRDEVAIPGSLLRANIASSHPITIGMGEQAAIFVDEARAFETTLPGSELERRVIASYGESGLLLSGWIHGEERLARKSAAVALTFGKGKIVLFAFRPQHRAQTNATFPLVFNSLLWSVQ